MNNDLEQFSEERLKEIEKYSSNHIRVQIVEIEALARIALAAKQAKPIGWMDTCELFDLRHGYTSKILPKKEMNNDIPLYTTTPPPHTEQGNQVEVLQFIINNPEKDGYFEWADCNQDYFNSTPKDHRRVLYTTPQLAHTEQVINITQVMLDAAVADYCTTGKYTVVNIPYELRRQVELEAESTFKAMLAAAPKPESEL